MNSLRILSFSADGTGKMLVTDTLPRFSFSYEGTMTGASISVDGHQADASAQIGIACPLSDLKPFSDYEAELTVWNETESDTCTFHFRTGRLHLPWQAAWITDGSYIFREKKVSPKVMVFRRRFSAASRVVRAEIAATALGVYELTLNGRKVGNRYFAPGFTSYQHNLQYQVYDVTDLIGEENVLTAEAAGGWAVGTFVMTRANRITADRQALLLELRLTCEDGSVQVIGTDESWEVSTEGPVRMADLYDGETYDARISYDTLPYHPASREILKIHPQICAEIGAPVVRHERLVPKYLHKTHGKLVFDFGQNFAGVIELKVTGRAGQQITVRHAEILKADGDLNTAFLNSAKATFTYVCRDGEQTYAPRFSYMGFRYISVEGIERENLAVSAWIVYSDIEECGSFSCSDALLNRLNENIRWSSRSNFVEIPTDCPQRDERMGWTGDIALFAPTALFNFDVSRFLNKWMRDMRAEQNRSGGFPNTIPSQSYGFPTTMPKMAVDFWDDACMMVPWAVYMASGDRKVLEDACESIERYLKACRFWAGLIGFGKQRLIWHTPAMFHFGDWIAPDVPKMAQWQGRSRWTATASMFHTAKMLSRILELLGRKEEAEKYRTFSLRVADAYQSLLMEEDGKLKKEEFQTGYVLPLYFGMLDEKHRKGAVRHLVELVKKHEYRIGTGFPGTPYILFALADNGEAETAYRMLMNKRCPSWLHEVNVGATTIWERWDGLDENGNCPIGDDGTHGMISYNHYASGAVGDFLYRRVAGIEAMTAGYRTFRVQPVPGGGLTFAKASVRTPFGTAASEWHCADGNFSICVQVPCGTTCTLTMPSGDQHVLSSGEYCFSEKYQA